MNLLDEEKKELEEMKVPRKTLSQLYNLIDVSDYHKHLKSKEYFIKQGQAILPVMHKLMCSEHKVIRKEAIKVVRKIANRSSIPPAIRMLSDPESEIRWIAAEALIHIGRLSIKPILEALVMNGESYYLRQGAHHVLKALIEKEDAKELKQLLKMIRHDTEIPERIPVKAALALEKEAIL